MLIPVSQDRREGTSNLKKGQKRALKMLLHTPANERPLNGQVTSHGPVRRATFESLVERGLAKSNRTMNRQYVRFVLTRQGRVEAARLAEFERFEIRQRPRPAGHAMKNGNPYSGHHHL